MAYPIEVTISTGNKVSLNYQSQEVAVSLIYKLERGDADMLAVVDSKARELVTAHALAWERVKAGGDPEPEEEEERADEMVIAEEQQHRTGDVSPAQALLIRALACQAGWSDDELKEKTRTDFGRDMPEELDREQAATLLLELGQSERERFERERVRNVDS